ncbi:MAG: DUF4382 domain-containing protein [Proteobacteria bacterium]|nr:DUF4382 domain-containing protein [Pseudomonadota bacterium]
MTVDRTGRSHAARILFALAAALLALLSSCGGNSVPPPGTPIVTFDAVNTKFVSYVVAIDSITLTGSDGVYATPLVSPQTVDLAKLSDLAELVEAPAVPSGSYTSATVTLDYLYSNIWAQNNGFATQLAPVLPSGTTTAVVTITFDPKHPLVINYGQSTRMAVHFDLDAFNSISLADKTVNVNPFVTINQPPLDQAQMRARGVFVYTTNNSFVMNMRPFFDLTSALGAVYVAVSPQTYWNVDGVTYVGNQGLAALKGLPINTPIAAYGTLLSQEGITPTFNASTVIVGTSLESPGLTDHVRGIVGARTGNSLTILGADYFFSTDAATCVNSLFYTSAGLTYFLPKATVNIGTSTIVSRDGYGLPQSIDSISVGQEVDIGGLSTCASDGYVTLDATQTQVRLLNTRIWGDLTSVNPILMHLDILSLGTYDNSAFNFTGTATGGGGVPRSDYTVNTQGIDVVGTPANTLMAADGFVSNFGTAPPAFTATAITPGAATQQSLVIEWGDGGSAKPFQAIHPDGLIVDLTTFKGTVLGIYTGPTSIDLNTLVTSPIITSVGAVQAQVVLAVGNNTLTTGVSTYQSMSDFATALETVFNGTNKIFRLDAIGNYNSASNTFVATRISVSLEN